MGYCYFITIFRNINEKNKIIDLVFTYNKNVEYARLKWPQYNYFTKRKEEEEEEEEEDEEEDEEEEGDVDMMDYINSEPIEFAMYTEPFKTRNKQVSFLNFGINSGYGAPMYDLLKANNIKCYSTCKEAYKGTGIDIEKIIKERGYKSVDDEHFVVKKI